MKFSDPTGLVDCSYSWEYGPYDVYHPIKKIETGNKVVDFLGAAGGSCLNFFGGCLNVITNGFGAAGELYETGVNWLDENIPSYLTLTGSFKQDLDALTFISVANPQLLYDAQIKLSECIRYYTPITTPKISPSTQAKEWQGVGNYPGVDDWTDVKIKEGSYIWGATPGQSNFYTTTSDMVSAGNDATKIFEGLQVGKNGYPTYRPEMTLYRVPYDMDVAISQAVANPEYGAGGFTQFFIPNYSDLEPVATVQLINR